MLAICHIPDVSDRNQWLVGEEAPVGLWVIISESDLRGQVIVIAHNTISIIVHNAYMTLL